jgi:molybdenum cofactor biosynthesis protein B
MLSRATAGIADDAPIYLLPGSADAAALGVREAVLPELGHVVGLARR